ncbi:tripartite tricarboxylate transporter substrate binding protein [Roseomonas sp. JC162]|uniref:Tripartite tricarboxylate transporter substrate binding protein n=1 Tax=Neoroseomonas marina TaxID=1232220 RepID=A0A848EIK4_9PROT|nr:tripartite tricarboxylate transporter substrate binding protein [Neoroseomonas marina]NMJ43509.1 tripartite tricarboxylate transporter substrate binding protein [Neoroseomonas marina]
MFERRRLAIAGAALVTAAARPALAQDASAAPLRIVVPYSAGGPTDVQARVLAGHLERVLGRPVVVENRTGAGVLVGTEAVAKARPDGQTLLLTTVAHAVNPSLLPRLPYDTERDFAPVALVATVPLVILVRPDLPAPDGRAFLAWLRAQRGRATYGSAGVGSAPHIGTALLLMMANAQAEHVPYRGTAPAMTDLAAGRIDFYLDAVATGIAQAQGGSVRALAVTSASRSGAAPEMPTLAEQGLPGYEAYTWSGIFAPAGTPPDTVARLNAAVREAVADPALRRRFAEIGAELAAPAAPEALGTFVRAEIAKWSQVVASSGMRAE